MFLARKNIGYSPAGACDSEDGRDDDTIYEGSEGSGLYEGLNSRNGVVGREDVCGGSGGTLARYGTSKDYSGSGDIGLRDGIRTYGRPPTSLFV